MRIPEALPPLTYVSLLRTLKPEGVADLSRVLRSFQASVMAVLHNGLELGDNFGEAVTGTTSATAHNQNTVAHNLGRLPKFLWLMAEADPATDAFPIQFYWTPSDYTSWSTTLAYFRCNQPSIVYRGFVI